MSTLNKISVDNVVYDIGGTTECLIVTLDVDPHSSITTASHSPAEIRQALLADIPVFVQWVTTFSDKDGTVLFIPVIFAEVDDSNPEYNMAVADYVDTTGEEGTCYVTTLIIKNDKSVEIKATTLATDSMLQEELGGYLSKTNTTEYTPSADYHPATKKYVDDHAASANIIKTGITDPNTETVGNFVGQIYCNTRKDTAYQLVSITKIDGETYYNWTKLVRGNDKVTSLSSNSTDEQYPTAKAVKDYVDEKQTYFKLLNTVTGRTPIQLPTDYNEILIVSTYHQGSYDQTFSTHLTKNDITNKQYIYTGFYYSATEHATCNWYINNNEIVLNTLSINGTAYHTVGETKLYIK